ncbi:GL22367 [Drosophila persimilis]|uniref:GL22367 n=1 Tax=Drosophila persimilis TaxID=7234 RepID=B4IS08_DROPE|nr:GL22367 [Drosophila persimilis]
MTRKAHPDAIIIAAKDPSSYAEILRKVKGDEKLQGLGEAVARIRRTQKGELLLQLSKSGEETSSFLSLVGESLGDAAEVRALQERVIVECSDLDEVTTKEEIRHWTTHQ